MLSGQRSMRAVPGAEPADPRLQEAFRAATAGSRPAAAASPALPQRPLEGDCPICYDELTVSLLWWLWICTISAPPGTPALLHCRHILIGTAFEKNMQILLFALCSPLLSPANRVSHGHL